MAKAATPFTKVKDYSYKLPGIMLADAVKKKVAVMLSPDSGIFTMKLPEEVASLLGGNDYVSDRDMNTCIREFDRRIEKFHWIIRTTAAKPVIVIWWAYNKPVPEGSPANLRPHVGIGGDSLRDTEPSTALGLEYEVMYQIGEALYDVHVDEATGQIYGMPHHRMSLPAKGRKVMPWTEERERFVENMVKAMEGLIDKVQAFFGQAFIENIDRAIETGVSALALPAPQREEEE